MDYFQGIVEDYLRADRASFNNPEFYLQRTEIYESGKTNWFVDILNVNFREKRVYLCEITYARNPAALRKRLHSWAENWPIVLNAVRRDAQIPDDWTVRVWIFCPDSLVTKVTSLLPSFECPPRITTLEMTVPWMYSESSRTQEKIELKPNTIPEPMKK